MKKIQGREEAQGSSEGFHLLFISKATFSGFLCKLGELL